jgi:hypothetical protein
MFRKTAIALLFACACQILALGQVQREPFRIGIEEQSSPLNVFQLPASSHRFRVLKGNTKVDQPRPMDKQLFAEHAALDRNLDKRQPPLRALVSTNGQLDNCRTSKTEPLDGAIEKHEQFDVRLRLLNPLLDATAPVATVGSLTPAIDAKPYVLPVLIDERSDDEHFREAPNQTKPLLIERKLEPTELIAIDAPKQVSTALEGKLLHKLPAIADKVACANIFEPRNSVNVQRLDSQPNGKPRTIVMDVSGSFKATGHDACQATSVLKSLDKEAAARISVETNAHITLPSRPTSWSDWYKRIASLYEPLLLEAADNAHDPQGANTVEITVYKNHAVDVQIVNSATASFDNAILQTYRSLNGNPLLEFPKFTFKTKIKFLVEHSHLQGSISGINSRTISVENDDDEEP